MARAEHAEYERALAGLGCLVQHVTPAQRLPDSVFVEDAAIVLEEVAIITRPGAVSRREEIAAVADALGPYRALRFVTAPATLDGGDVLRLDRTLYVGIGGRTNACAVEQLAGAVRPFDYEVRSLRIDRCLHLKSAVTEAAGGLLVLNPAWVDAAAFGGHDRIEVDPGEPFAANVLRVGGTVICAAAHDRTAGRLRGAGLSVQTLDVSELAKAEAGVTCCSLIFNN